MKLKISVADSKEWRSWLMKNHAKMKEVWLVYYKKQTGKPTINYIESVENALCFGWIDGLKKSIDDERYAYVSSMLDGCKAQKNRKLEKSA